MFPVRVPPQSAFTRVVGGTSGGARKPRRGGGEGATGGGSGPGSPGSGDGASSGSGSGSGRKRRHIKAGGWLLLALWGAAAVGVVAYAARRDIAREVAEGWLRAQGVPAELRIDSLSFSHVSGRAVLGTPGRPDLSIERFDVDYDLNLLNLGQPLSRIRRVYLHKPDLTFSYDKKGLGFGTLDRLLKGGGGAGAPIGEVLVEEARVRVRTDYGLIAGTGGLSLKDGRLRALDLNLRPGEISGLNAQGALSDGYVRIRAVPDADAGEALRIEARLSAEDLNLSTAAAEGEGDTRVQGVHADLSLRVPYRRLSDETSRTSPLSMFDGQVSGNVALRADAAQGAVADVTAFEGNVTLDGRLDLENTRLNFMGQAQLLAQMDGLQTGLSDGRDVSLGGHGLQLNADLSLDGESALTLEGPVSAHVGLLRQDDLFMRGATLDLSQLWLAHGNEGTDLRFTGTARAVRLAQGDLSLDGMTASLEGNGRLGSAGYEVALTTDIDGREGRYQGMGTLASQRKKDINASREALIAANTRLPEGTPPVPLPPQGPDAMVALTRAADRFALKAEGVRLTFAGDGANSHFDIRLGKGALIRPESGGEIRLTPEPLKPFLSSRERGGFGVQTAGDSLPPLSAQISDFGFAGIDSALTGRLRVNGTVTVAPVYGARFDTQGHFAMTGGATRLSLDSCFDVKADRADIGGRLSDAVLRVCPTDKPILSIANGQWRSEGRFEGLTGSAPDYQVTVADGAGQFAAFSFVGAEGLGFTTTLSHLKVTDALEVARFHPVLVEGDVKQGPRTLDGKLFVTAADSAVRARMTGPLAEVVLRSDVVTGTGRADVTAANLSFAPQQLQPLDLTPMLTGLIQRDTAGKADFTGYFTWSKAGGESGGVLHFDEMAFTGPAGYVEGLNGRLAFTSLAPLISEPGQALTVRRVVSVVPLKDARVAMQFAGDYLKLEAAQVTSEGGDFALAPMEVPFDIAKGFAGELRFEQVDFGKVVESSPFTKEVDFEGKVSGKWPFEFRGGKLSIRKGYLLGEGPGRVSILRSGVKDVAADGAAVASAGASTTEAPPNAILGMAYQAMEHLAYNELSATVNTDDNGLLNFNFRITGRYDPPEMRETRIGLVDYLRGVWMEKPLDLPSGTPVNLNLEVNYNLDAFLKDYIEAQKRGGIDWSKLK